MSNHEPLSRSDLTSRTGVPNDVLTHWLRYGLVRPIYAPAGIGRHLRFEWYEANIAAIMHQLRMLGFHMDGMLSIAAVYREAILWASRYELSRSEVNALWTVFNLYGHHARHPDDEQLAHDLEQFSQERHGDERVTERIKVIHAEMPEAEFRRHLDPFLTVTEQPEPGESGLESGDPGELTFFWRVGEGDEVRSGFGADGVMQARSDGAVAMVAIDVTSILSKVWNPDELAG